MIGVYNFLASSLLTIWIIADPAVALLGTVVMSVSAYFILVHSESIIECFAPMTVVSGHLQGNPSKVKPKRVTTTPLLCNPEGYERSETLTGSERLASTSSTSYNRSDTRLVSSEPGSFLMEFEVLETLHPDDNDE